MKSLLSVFLSVDNPLSESARLMALIGLAFYAGEWHAWGYSMAWKVVAFAIVGFFAIHIVQSFKQWNNDPSVL